MTDNKCAYEQNGYCLKGLAGTPCETQGCVARTQADVDSAMAEVEEKSKAFTAAHQGETAEEILAAMRGEDAAESLGLSQEEYGKLVDECIYGEEPLDVDAIIEESKQAQADEILSQVIEEPASEDLEYVAMKEFPSDTPMLLAPDGHHISNGEALRWAFKKGAAWKLEQMMKAAIPGEWWRCGIAIPSKYMNTEEIKQVKVIIIQEG